MHGKGKAGKGKLGVKGGKAGKGKLGDWTCQQSQPFAACRHNCSLVTRLLTPNRFVANQSLDSLALSSRPQFDALSLSALILL